MCPSELSEAIKNAEQLLRYASAKGKELPQELVSQIVDAKKLLGTDDKDPATFQEQKGFWNSLAKLTAITTPATIDSVQFTAATEIGRFDRLLARLTGTPPKARTMGVRAVSRAGWIATILLVFVGVMQLYADVGGTTVQEYAANKLKYAVNHRMLPATPPQPPTEADASRRAETAMLLEKSERQLEIMEHWLFFRHFKQPPGSAERATEVLGITELILLILRGFILPIGWGALGAALYVSRTLADDIRTMAYAADQQTLHKSRYYLGAVAGFVVVKFSTALTGKPLDDVVHPFVIALLVGYSVDVLFNLFDKVIATFSSK